MLRLLAGIAIFRRRLVRDCQPGWELVAQLYSGCGRKVVSNSGVVPSERYRKFGLSAGANEIRNLGLAVYGPRRGRAANRLLARGPELNTGPQPVVLGSPFGSTPAETFVRVGPRVRIRFPPAASQGEPWAALKRTTGRQRPAGFAYWAIEGAGTEAAPVHRAERRREARRRCLPAAEGSE